jgi:NTE family protein
MWIAASNSSIVAIRMYVIAYSRILSAMTLDTLTRPDVLVLGGGGIVGEAWMSGVLAGIEEATAADFRRVETYVGTSAGSIVAASLAAGRSPRRPGERSPAGPAADGERVRSENGGLGSFVSAAARAGWAATAPLAPVALAAGAPGGALARAAVLARVPNGGRSLGALRAEVKRSGVRFDGRLRIACVDKASGRRVLFGAPGAPRATVPEAVEASCSIPWVFAPVRISGRDYVDGGVWSPTNLDAAPAGRDTHVLCLQPTASMGAGSTAFGLLRQGLRAAAAVEETALRRRGAHVRRVGPDPEAGAAMGPNLMDGRKASAALAAGFRQGRELAAG